MYSSSRETVDDVQYYGNRHLATDNARDNYFTLYDDTSSNKAGQSSHSGNPRLSCATSHSVHRITELPGETGPLRAARSWLKDSRESRHAVKRVSRKVASAMTATYTKERELPAARSTLEPVNVQVLLHHRDGVESERRARCAEKPELRY